MIRDNAAMDRPVKQRGPVRRILPLLLILIPLVAIGAAFYPSLSRWVAADRSIDGSRLRTTKVERGDLLRDVGVQGKIIAAYHPTLVSPAQGVVALAVRAGDLVRTGSLLARISSPELQNQLEQERSRLLSLRADLDRQRISARQTAAQNQRDIDLLVLKLKANERAMERAKALYEERLGSQMDFEKTRDEVELVGVELRNSREKDRLEKETLDFDIRNRELQVERQLLVVNDLERRVSELSVVSPVNGLVSKIEVRDKGTVQPNQPLLDVVDLSEFEVEIDIPEEYADECAVGTKAVVDYNGVAFQGALRSLSPEVEASQVKAIVAFTEGAPSGLKQNQRVNTRLVLDARRNVLKVARGPFLESLGARQVYVVQDGLAVLRAVRVGTISVSEIEIVSGLDEGEEIVLSDLTRFEGAQRILLR
ncbi:MAG: HlyD family efflux transporter periplasmic adaptor subunit [Acidobacteria bacterium]|nr:MAG: HlyD family efflux transporter periplasmic adaptor subunit [Acidobacteriota bacterium]